MTKLVSQVQSVYDALSRYHNRSVTSFDYLAREAREHTAGVVDVMRKERDRIARENDTRRAAWRDQSQL